MNELPLPRSEQELISAVIGRGGGPELLPAVVQLGRIPFWRRRTFAPADLCRDFGIKPSVARRLVALWELAERWYPDERPGVHTVHDAVLLFDHLRSLQREQVEVLLLDARHRLIGSETVAVGSVNTSRLLPRDVFAPALRSAAVSIIVGHNHPSGDPTPSNADCTVTDSLRAGAAMLGIGFVDHLILGAHAHYSFRESSGWDGARAA